MPDDKTTLKRLIITTVKDAKAPTPHARRLAEAKTAIAADEARLKLTGAKRLRFLATFRLKDVTSPMKGAYAERREHLITRIKALAGTGHHISTSAWSVLSYRGTREAVLDALKPAIDETIDYLEVVQTGAPVHAGVRKLKD